jgi:hypothetical protein
MIIHWNWWFPLDGSRKALLVGHRHIPFISISYGPNYITHQISHNRSDHHDSGTGDSLCQVGPGEPTSQIFPSYCWWNPTFCWLNPAKSFAWGGPWACWRSSSMQGIRPGMTRASLISSGPATPWSLEGENRGAHEIRLWKWRQFLGIYIIPDDFLSWIITIFAISCWIFPIFSN